MKESSFLFIDNGIAYGREYLMLIEDQDFLWSYDLASCPPPAPSPISKVLSLS
jgi:hypothetical protein